MEPVEGFFIHLGLAIQKPWIPMHIFEIPGSASKLNFCPLLVLKQNGLLHQCFTSQCCHRSCFDSEISLSQCVPLIYRASAQSSLNRIHHMHADLQLGCWIFDCIQHQPQCKLHSCIASTPIYLGSGGKIHSKPTWKLVPGGRNTSQDLCTVTARGLHAQPG